MRGLINNREVDQFMAKIERSRTNKLLAGVCGGLGEAFDINPNIIRVIWVIATVLLLHVFLIGVLIYILCWVFLPEAGDPDIIEAEYTIKK